MKCFIASAFGHADVDEVYDRCIRPTLKQLLVTPLRVDRVEHNEDIDNKIFELLDAADFAIVDLTYARPSVYYEAGYAAGKGKPVIYITRYDHFKARENDPHGLLRVHFDLQMKNIISWKSANEEFSQKLLLRLQHILKPLLKKIKAEAEIKNEQADFARLPLNSQTALLRDKAISLLQARSFNKYLENYPFPHNGNHLSMKAIMVRKSSKRLQTVIIMCASSALKTLFEAIQSKGPYIDPFFMQNDSIEAEVHLIVASLKPVPRARVVDALSNFHPTGKNTFHENWEKKRVSFGSGIDVFVHVFDQIKTPTQFTDNLRSIVKDFGLEKG